MVQVCIILALSKTNYDVLRCFLLTNKGTSAALSDDYGGHVNASCPITLHPTTDPTEDPTIDPTIHPTEPTLEPTMNPTGINTKLKQIAIEMDTINEGLATIATITVFWHTDQYSCQIKPYFADNTTTYLCDNETNAWSTNTIIAGKYVPHYVKIQFFLSFISIQITGINITDINNNWYFIDDFCIR